MPKKPRFVNQVRRLRTDALHLTQPQFAKLIGISASMLQAVELGVRKLSPALADRISYATGVDPESLLVEGSELRTLIGGPYLSVDAAKENVTNAMSQDLQDPSTDQLGIDAVGRQAKKRSRAKPRIVLKKESQLDFQARGRAGGVSFSDSFSSWKRLAGIQEPQVASYGRMLGHSIELLLFAAARVNGLKAYAIGHSMVRWLHQTAREFDVLKHMESVVAERNEIPSRAPFLDPSAMDRDPSQEWLFYQGGKSTNNSVNPEWQQAAAQHEARLRERFKWYGKRLPKKGSTSGRAK